MPSKLAKYLCTRNQVICILFFTYIYDLVRAGFIESRKRQLKILKTIEDRVDDKGLQLSVSNSASNSYIGPPRFSVTYLRDSNLSSLPNMQISYRPAFIRRLRSSQVELDSVGHTLNWLRSEGLQVEPLQRPIQQAVYRSPGSVLPKSSPIAATMLQSFSFTSSRRPIIEPAIFEQQTPVNKGENSSKGERHEIDDHHFDDQKLEDECPLGPMPKLVRYYQYVSLFLVMFSFIKYSFLVVFDNELFGSKRAFSCYVPGRVAILPEFSPSFSWIVLCYHVVYRFYLCVIRKEFNLDCFIFLLYDKKAVEAIETKKCTELQCSNLIRASRIYAMNRLFFVKVYLRGEPQQVIYRIKSNRNIEHWIKLKQFFNRFVIISLGNIALWSIPLGIAVVWTVLSTKNFSTLYGACHEMTLRHKTNWTLFDLRLLLWFLCDIIDSSWLLLDTTMALVMPFTSMVICSQDLNITIDKLRDIVADITPRLQCAIDAANPRYRVQNISMKRNQRLTKMFKDLEVEILVIQSEVARMLQQINQVDEFMSKLSAFCVSVWILTNIYIQIITLNLNKLVLVDVVVQFMQGTALVALTFTFAYIARVNTKTRRLYQAICNLVAIDPNHKTKSSWLLVLEYFNKVKPNFSFRLGPFTELTLANYLKACSWLITGALITINLFKYKYDIS